MGNIIVEKFVPPTVLSELENRIKSHLDRCGLYYRLFCRLKSSESAERKIKTHGYPTSSGKLMQDLIGIRIALYFSDDVPICKTIIEKLFDVDNVSETYVDEAVFSPEKLNLVCKIPDDLLCEIDSSFWAQNPIDRTFEIQIRTVFSEGWHEIEHDVRYKTATDWKPYKDLSRSFNGIFATLETCDWAILQLLESLSYQEYKNKHWISMFRNKLRIHLRDDSLNDEIMSVFDEDSEVAKAFYKIDRTALIRLFAYENPKIVPLTLNNIVYVMNLMWVRNSKIEDSTPALLKKFFSESL